MASGLVIHIISGEDKHTEVLSYDRIRIGTGEACDLRLRSSTLPANAVNPVVVELLRTNGNYRVSKFDNALDITLNGEPIEVNTKIRDGDELLIEDTSLAMHFFMVRSLPMVVGQRRDGASASILDDTAMEVASSRRDDAKVFLREFTRELVREIKPSTKIASIAIAVALVVGILYIGFSLYKEVQRTRRANEEYNAKLAQLQDQARQAESKVNDANEQSKRIIDSLSLAPKIVTEYSRGVCLITGSYVFIEPTTGRALRYPESQMSDDGVAIQNGNDPTELTPDGNGSVAEFEFVGTGFYVGDGFVLTNKHVAQPWLADERAQNMQSSGVIGKPRLKKLVAYFPGQTQPLVLKFKQAAARDDIAVCTIDTNELKDKVPVLPLDQDSDAIAIGKEVVMMGYPNGPDRLLALAEESEARSIQARYGASLDSLLNYLAEAKRIQPLSTRGYITDLDARRIVHSAQTAEGGSGAPIFGQSGRVIGVNFAVFTENTASNFAVPARPAIALLERSGWKAPEPQDAGQDDDSNKDKDQANSRNNTSGTGTSR